jgi:hypothetical protein
MLWQMTAVAQQPSRLTTDLIEHTDRVWLDGYLSNLSLNELKTAVERFQTVEIRNRRPVLGWALNSNRKNTLQTAYRVMLATSPDMLDKDSADVWDSRRTESDNSVAVAVESDLLPSTVYYWKVKTWDNHGDESRWSAIRAFVTADKLDGVTARYPLQITDEYPVRSTALSNSLHLFDFGKDAFGRLKLTIPSTLATADTILIRLGEAIKDGRIDRNPVGTVRYAEYRLPVIAGTHTYIIKIRPDRRNTNVGANESAVSPILMPDYTGEALPFRYCEVENCLPLTGHAVQVVRQTVHYPFDGTAAAFHSSDSTLNAVWEMCKYSVKATSFAGVYVDGDRERIPYEADALINQLCHYAADREFAIARYSHEYLLYHPTWPSEWAMQSVLMAWTDYLYTGNRQSLQRFYSDLKAKSLLGLKESNGLISTRTGKLTSDFLQTIHFSGDNFRDIVDWPQSEMDGFIHSDYNAVVNAYHYRALYLLSLIAEAVGNNSEKEEFARLASQMKKDFNRAFFDAEKGCYRDGVGIDHSSLHANMFAVAFGLVADRHIPSVLSFIRSRGMACSVYGSQFLGDAVYDAHNADYGLQLLASSGTRSWYNMLRAGSTISMEAWDNRYKPNQDWNHIWGAAALNLISRKLMGVEPLEPGFAKIRIKPQPATLRQATIKLPSIRGDIYVSFNNLVGESFTVEATVPVNATAEVWLPKLSGKYSLTVDGQPQKGTPSGNFVIVTAGSGRHEFVIN